jgi:hypothetical protein
MMIVMAGKRLAAAGVLVAAVAATAALWVVPHGTLASQSRAMQLRTSSLAQSAATTSQLPRLRAAVALPTSQSATWLPVVGLTATVGALVALMLIGVARQHRRTVTVTTRTPRRGRAPPSPRPHHAARTRNH